MQFRIFFSILFLAFSQIISAQVRTMGNTVNNAGHLNGYLLMSPLNSKNTYLIDKCGREINRWVSNYNPGVCVKMLNDGGILRTGTTQKNWFGQGIGGILERFDWDGNLTWSWKLLDSMEALHHDVTVMENGNILAVVWERVSQSGLSDAGRNPAKLPPSLWSERIIEIKPIGKDSADIVWEWHAMDHIIQNYDSKKPNYGTPSQYPQRFDINFVIGANNGADWFHINSIDYNPELDQIVVSAHTLGEIYVIDHSTNTVQAAGHTGGKQGKGGDVLYRWGNPYAYGLGNATNQALFKQHHAHWIPKGYANAGMIMVFNNGNGRTGGNYSSVELLQTPVDTLTGAYSRTSGQRFTPFNSYIAYQANPDPYAFYADFISGAYSLKNGHIMVTDGPKGRAFEIDETQNILWEYINPVNGSGPMTQGVKPTLNPVFRYEFVPDDFAGFKGKTLEPGAELELNAKPFAQCVTQQQNNISLKKVSPTVYVYPNPATQTIHFSVTVARVTVYDAMGKQLIDNEYVSSIETGGLVPGVYHVVIYSAGIQSNHRVLIQTLN